MERAANLHGHGGDVEGHEWVGRQQQVEEAGDVGQALQVVRKPGDEPAQRKEGRHAGGLNVAVQLLVRLQQPSLLVRG